MLSLGNHSDHLIEFQHNHWGFSVNSHWCRVTTMLFLPMSQGLCHCCIISLESLSWHFSPPCLMNPHLSSILQFKWCSSLEAFAGLPHEIRVSIMWVYSILSSFSMTLRMVLELLYVLASFNNVCLPQCLQTPFLQSLYFVLHHIPSI